MHGGIQLGRLLILGSEGVRLEISLPFYVGEKFYGQLLRKDQVMSCIALYQDSLDKVLYSDIDNIVGRLQIFIFLKRFCRNVVYSFTIVFPSNKVMEYFLWIWPFFGLRISYNQLF